VNSHLIKRNRARKTHSGDDAISITKTQGKVKTNPDLTPNRIPEIKPQVNNKAACLAFIDLYLFFFPLP
jgi:hypothetical protein